jgi:hypothetical protein
LKLLLIEGPKIRPTRATKCSERIIVRLNIKETMWSIIVYDPARKTIDEVSGCDKCFIPKFQWLGGMCEKSKPNFHNVSVLVL